MRFSVQTSVVLQNKFQPHCSKERLFLLCCLTNFDILISGNHNVQIHALVKIPQKCQKLINQLTTLWTADLALNSVYLAEFEC